MPIQCPERKSAHVNKIQPLWKIVEQWQCYFYIMDGWKVYPGFIPDGEQIVCKTYMTSDPAEETSAKERASVDKS